MIASHKKNAFFEGIRWGLAAMLDMYTRAECGDNLSGTSDGHHRQGEPCYMFPVGGISSLQVKGCDVILKKGWPPPLCLLTDGSTC